MQITDSETPKNMNYCGDDGLLEFAHTCAANLPIMHLREAWGLKLSSIDVPMHIEPFYRTFRPNSMMQTIRYNFLILLVGKWFFLWMANHLRLYSRASSRLDTCSSSEAVTTRKTSMLNQISFWSSSMGQRLTFCWSQSPSFELMHYTVRIDRLQAINCHNRNISAQLVPIPDAHWPSQQYRYNT